MKQIIILLLLTLTLVGCGNDNDNGNTDDSQLDPYIVSLPSTGTYYWNFSDDNGNQRTGKMFIDDSSKDFYFLGYGPYMLKGKYEFDNYNINNMNINITYDEYLLLGDGNNFYFGGFIKPPEHQTTFSIETASPITFKYKVSDAPSNYFMEFGFGVKKTIDCSYTINGSCGNIVIWYKQDVNLSSTTNSFNGYDSNGCQFDGIITDYFTDGSFKATTTVSSCSPVEFYEYGDSQIHNGEYEGIGHIDSYVSSTDGIPYDVIFFNFMGFNDQHSFKLRAYESDRNL